MIRLQRTLFRSDATFAVAGGAGGGSVLGLILALVFGPAAFVACGDSDDGVPSATRAAWTGGVASGLGTMAVEACESTAVPAVDGGGAIAGFGVAGATIASLVDGGLFEPLGSVSFVTTNSDAMPSAITAMTGRNDLRAISTARLDLA